MAIEAFHPAVASWFESCFESATETQLKAWQAIQQRQHTLIAAPTGSGKTLAAFLAAIDQLIQQGLKHSLKDETSILYVSPLKALSNDIQKNLQQPLLSIADELNQQGFTELNIEAAVRTGDTTQSERQRMRRKPPHILVTTPESLFILLTSSSGREMLSTIQTVIVDEIHALAANKRGAHLSLSLERLQALCVQPLVRIGLSATQKPIDKIARFLIGEREEKCVIIDSGYQRQRDLAIEIPDSPLDAVMSNEVWQEVYDRLASLINEHQTTLIFVNTRRLAERAARFLAERIGEEFVTAHHGSLSKEHRLHAEQRLKHGNLKALIATASLELGIDIGDIDLVCQLGSPRSISGLLQRVGRSGHKIKGIPKGRLFPLSRDDLVECSALLISIQQGELDHLNIINEQLDVLAQQIIAEVGSREWQEEALFNQIKSSYSYRNLQQKDFKHIIKMLAEGFTMKRGLRSRYIHYDAVNKILKPRKGAQLAAVTNAGAIPEQFDYDVILQPEGYSVGTLNEDFAFESLPGDIFQLGNTSYRIIKTQLGKVFVEDARGQPPNIPFWFGEAPGRTDELSTAVSQLRDTLDQYLQEGEDHAQQYLVDKLQFSSAHSKQLVDYLATTRYALGTIPTQEKIILERFYDEAGDQHLVLHSAYGVRLNRAWGLALRKRFCRQFNFELQAAALEDCIVLSLGATHSFPLEEVENYLNANSVREVLTQALLAAPMFMSHWRWNATTALAIKRNHNGKKVPAQFQRSDAEDLIALIFPDQLACQENIQGEREIPEHPLVAQTVSDCLNQVMDINKLEIILQKLKQKKIQFICKDLAGPSPLAQEILNARPYAFLDDAPAEERRTQAVQARRFAKPEDAESLGTLSQEAIENVRQQAWPEISSDDELHDALFIYGFLSKEEFKPEYQHYFDQLVRQKRATRILFNDQDSIVSCAERLPQIQALYTDAKLKPVIEAAGEWSNIHWTKESAFIELLRAHMQCLGPVDEQSLIQLFKVDNRTLQSALLSLQNEGFIMQGNFCQQQSIEWCERRLLARIHRQTLEGLRKQIKAVSPQRYMQFLFNWHGMGTEKSEGEYAVIAALEKLEGFSAAAAIWESDILPSRVDFYLSSSLDQLCSSGQFLWLRLNANTYNRQTEKNKASLLRNTPICLLPRQSIELWTSFEAPQEPSICSSTADKVLLCLKQNGALFFNDLVQTTGLLRTQLEEALAELSAYGFVTSDAYIGLRALITPSNKRPSYGRQGRRRTAPGNPGIRNNDVDNAGRWSCIHRTDPIKTTNSWLATDEQTLEHIAWVLLRRYGVVFRKVLTREAPLPPWRELLYIYRRMEARGDIRGGRFVEGFSGEQFALPEAIGLLRKEHTQPDQIIAISACDPLNLAGILLPGEKIPAHSNTRLVFKNGLLIAIQSRDKIDFFNDMTADEEWQIKNQLIRKNKPATYINQMLRRQH